MEEKKLKEHLETLKRENSASSFKPKKKKCVILSLDGGGMRGLITCVLLERIQEVYPDIFDRVDYIAGCSNGGFAESKLKFFYTFFKKQLEILHF